MSTLPKGLRFRRVSGRGWNGNGFGTDSAKWVAEFNGVKVGSWFKPSIGSPKVVIGRRETLSTTSYRRWRELIVEHVMTTDETDTFLIQYRSPADSQRAGRDIWRPVRMQRPIESAENASAVASALASETKIPHRAVKVVTVQVVVTAGLGDQTDR